MDYRKFLGKTEARVLPYFGGTRVDDERRRLRVSVEQPPGWYAFEISGRVATVVDAADAPDLSALPAARGHFAAGWLFAGGRDIARVELLPADEPPVLSPITARRWPSGDLVFEGLEFEHDAENLARVALEEERDIDSVKAVGASLRAAFAFALTAQVGRALEVAVSPREVSGALLDIAARGRPAAEALLRDLAERRRLEQVRLQSHQAQADRAAGVEPRGGWQRPPANARGAATTPAERAARALDAAGADLVGTRSMGSGMLEVTYRFLGERFISVVDEQSLQVLDAGICLSGADREVTLESLPSVIREGHETDQLNITRR